MLVMGGGNHNQEANGNIVHRLEVNDVVFTDSNAHHQIGDGRKAHMRNRNATADCG